MLLTQFRSIQHILSLSLIAFTLTGCKVAVNVVGDGAGLVTSDVVGVECGNIEDKCSVLFDKFGSVELTATSEPGATFVGWEGDCEGSESTCELTLGIPREVTAIFEANDSPTLDCATQGAKANCLTPKQPPEYYVEQSVMYFDTLASDVSVLVQPNYSLMVVRWEWPPWLLLTGLGNANLILTDVALKLFPTVIAEIDCRAFDTQPYGRCHMVFDYSGELCPIYEEFSFNDQGEITFIEAWTDLPGWTPTTEDDYWAEGEHVKRLATRVPGLGNANGLVDFDATWMEEAAKQDADVGELMKRGRRPYGTYLEEIVTHAVETAEGCNPGH